MSWKDVRCYTCDLCGVNCRTTNNPPEGWVEIIITHVEQPSDRNVNLCNKCTAAVILANDTKNRTASTR